MPHREIPDYALPKDTLKKLAEAGFELGYTALPTAVIMRHLACHALRQVRVSAPDAVVCTGMERSTTGHQIARLARIGLLVSPREVTPPAGEIGSPRTYYQIAPAAAEILQDVPPHRWCPFAAAPSTG
ncbi:MAG: hypothetical protein AAB834_07725 [Patescibacteria group bacterium]